ncbi:tyrosinase family protein [Paenibacillus polymyxa]|uniref:tyrosinase family protein n=1 Tax=Paenibacillus polymyxa TaxID=1406 RepID=UPI00156139E1|nr:tyrosinase family protein [Paenibacillus polymyxa]
MIELQRRDGTNSYIDLAGYHWIPREFCPHGESIFLPWHRVYIRLFEQALQSIDPSVSLPFWDWTSSESLAQGLAPAHGDEMFDDGGVPRLNPLFSGPIEDRSRQTRRNPPQALRRLREHASAAIDAMSDSNDFMSFTVAIEGPHGDIHGWVGGPGGDMSTILRSAYDPIFWSHHANVDRQWAIWQKCNPQGNPPPEIMSLSLESRGFPGWSVADTLDLSSPRLDYTYEGLDTVTCPIRTLHELFGKPRIKVEIKNIVITRGSFIVDIYLRRKNSALEEGVFSGSFSIFGLPSNEGGHFPGHHHHHTPVNRLIDVTEAFYGMELGEDQLHYVDIQLQAVNMDGESVDPAALPIEGVELTIPDRS